jgi:hypothetical protein
LRSDCWKPPVSCALACSSSAFMPVPAMRPMLAGNDAG